MEDLERISHFMYRHRKANREIKACIDSCDGNRNHARAHYFNLEHLEKEKTKLETILLVHVPENFLINQIQTI
jgi:hypothetical protein